MLDFHEKLISEKQITLKEGYFIVAKFIGRYIQPQPYHSTALPDWTSLELNIQHTCDAVISTTITINNINSIDLESISNLFKDLTTISKTLNKASAEIKEAEKKILEILKENGI